MHSRVPTQHCKFTSRGGGARACPATGRDTPDLLHGKGARPIEADQALRSLPALPPRKLPRPHTISLPSWTQIQQTLGDRACRARFALAIASVQRIREVESCRRSFCRVHHSVAGQPAPRRHLRRRIRHTAVLTGRRRWVRSSEYPSRRARPLAVPAASHADDTARTRRPYAAPHDH